MLGAVERDRAVARLDTALRERRLAEEAAETAVRSHDMVSRELDDLRAAVEGAANAAFIERLAFCSDLQIRTWNAAWMLRHVGKSEWEWAIEELLAGLNGIEPPDIPRRVPPPVPSILSTIRRERLGQIVHAVRWRTALERSHNLPPRDERAAWTALPTGYQIEDERIGEAVAIIAGGEVLVALHRALGALHDVAWLLEQPNPDLAGVQARISAELGEDAAPGNLRAAHAGVAAAAEELRGQIAHADLDEGVTWMHEPTTAVVIIERLDEALDALEHARAALPQDDTAVRLAFRWALADAQDPSMTRRTAGRLMLTMLLGEPLGPTLAHALIDAAQMRQRDAA